jgi:signal transduction histidine kinase
MKSPSIRWSLLLRCGVGVGVLLCLLSSGVYFLVKQSLYLELDESIAQTAALLANQVELENENITYEWKEGIGTNRELIADGLFQFWDEKTGTTTRSPGLQSHDLPRFSHLDGSPSLRTIRLPNGHHARAIGLRVNPFVLPEEVARMKQRGRVIDPKSLPHILVLARDSEPVHHTLERLRWTLSGGSLLTLALGFMLIHRVIRVTLQPINELTLQMKDRAEHQLDSALVLPRKLPAELTGLAENFDSLLARVAAIRERERDFIRHAAHELRTPIAGLRATTDLALSQPREAATYAEHLAICQKTAIELGELVNRLSALSRIGQASSLTRLEPLNVSVILMACLDSVLSIFHERGLEVKHELPEQAMITRGDATLLRIIFNNLLDNAACYSNPGDEVHIHGNITGRHIEIRIANPASDLPENLERLFEPLFRKETSRSDAHLGIGLTLSLEAATAMGATLQARKTHNGGIEFILDLIAC